MNDSSNANPLLAVRSAIYSNKGALSEVKAIAVLEELASQNNPEAMHQLGQLLWEGIAVEANEERAYSLISAAVELGHSPAMVSLGAMYLVGAGCSRSFSQALRWYRKRDETSQEHSSVRIGKVGLNEYEFRKEFQLELNGNCLTAPDSVLARINHWLVESKAKVVAKQSAMLDRNPSMFGGMSKRRLPYYGAIGGSCFVLTGTGAIERVSWRDAWDESELSVDWSEFAPGSKPQFFAELESLGGLEPSVVQKIREASSAEAPHGAETAGQFIELKFVATSVHRAVTVVRGGKIVYEHIDD